MDITVQYILHYLFFKLKKNWNVYFHEKIWNSTGKLADIF